MALPISRPKLPVAVHKATPYSFDLGLLLANDPNPLELDNSAIEDSLAATARDGAQALINQLLTTCPLQSTAEGVLLTLPPPSTDLPREKPVPKPKEPTKWERFAAKRGIKAKTREQRKNLVFDEDTQEWRRKWGYKGMNKKGEDDWVHEVDPKEEANRAEGTTIQGDKRRERKERIKRNERKMRKNQREAAGKR
ncbi:Regulator of ribosome biosynthesis [Colletotrichum chlorophyti]|uniref:Ribosome biogenesis regulatory protein n=1 Tax=Colletotrichum chlorophyti TaxID=708187 RepID=A0A1Q8RU74_9PEZI|nr:Regulator of ribosome biosynthesis [Colletotrichum chlorophyti]